MHDRLADLERLRADWKRVFRDSYLAQDYELEEIARLQIVALDREIGRECARIETEDQ